MGAMLGVLSYHKVEVGQNTLRAVERVSNSLDDAVERGFGINAHTLEAVDRIGNVVDNAVGRGVGLNANTLSTIDRMSRNWERSVEILTDIRRQGLVHRSDIEAARTMFLELRACSAQASLDAQALSSQVGDQTKELIQTARTEMVAVVNSVERGITNVTCIFAFNAVWVVANITNFVFWFLAESALTLLFVYWGMKQIQLALQLHHASPHTGVSLYLAQSRSITREASLYCTYAAIGGLVFVLGRRLLQGNSVQMPPLNEITQFAPQPVLLHQAQHPQQNGDIWCPVLGTIQAYMGPIPDQQQQPFYVPGSDNHYMFCLGQSLSIKEFWPLYQVIGNRSDISDDNSGSTLLEGRFRMPDLRGQFLRGCDSQSVRGPRFGSEDTVAQSEAVCDPDYQNRTVKSNYRSRGDFLGSRQRDAIKNHGHRYYWPNKFWHAHSSDTPGVTLVQRWDSHWGGQLPNSPEEELLKRGMWEHAAEFEERGDIGGFGKVKGIEVNTISLHETRPRNVSVHYIMRVC